MIDRMKWYLHVQAWLFKAWKWVCFEALPLTNQIQCALLDRKPPDGMEEQVGW
jgi:hypothetical protein